MEDYKQKYEEALERAKCYKGLIAEMEIIFPELKEGEDEWIRKSIIGFLKTLASLKDGKTVSNEDFNSETLLEWATWLEKQRKLKPAGKMQVSEKLYEYIRNTCAGIDDALSSKTLADVTDYLEQASTDAQSAFDMIEKQVEQKPAWSEEDERMLNLIIQDYEAASKSFCGYQGKLDWLKSLRPQYHWKPSEEQDAVGMLVNLGYPISTNGEIPTYEETFEDCKNTILHRLQKKADSVVLNKSISLSSGGVNTETLLKDTYMQAYREGVDDIIKQLKEICS